jgi:hypothetical protein
MTMLDAYDAYLVVSLGGFCSTMPDSTNFASIDFAPIG